MKTSQSSETIILFVVLTPVVIKRTSSVQLGLLRPSQNGTNLCGTAYGNKLNAALNTSMQYPLKMSVPSTCDTNSQ